MRNYIWIFLINVVYDLKHSTSASTVLQVQVSLYVDPGPWQFWQKSSHSNPPLLHTVQKGVISLNNPVNIKGSVSNRSSNISIENSVYNLSVSGTRSAFSLCRSGDVGFFFIAIFIWVRMTFTYIGVIYIVGNLVERFRERVAIRFGEIVIGFQYFCETSAAA